jgi:hypothetical protein
VARGGAAVPRVGGRSAGGAWRGVAPAARQRSAGPRVGDVWECRSPIVNRDCHVSQVAVLSVLLTGLCLELKRPFFA